MTTAAASPAATHPLEWLAIALTQAWDRQNRASQSSISGRLKPFFVLHGRNGRAPEFKPFPRSLWRRASRGTGARAEIARASAADVTVISMDDPSYPPRLKEIYDPWLILYVRGNPEVPTNSGIAMVGTRHPTPYGSGMAERLACDLAAQGVEHS